MTNPTPHGQVPASSAVLKAIREANMQLVRTGDDAFMLVPYLQAHVQNPAEIEHVAGDVSKNGAEVDMSTQPAAHGGAYAELPESLMLEVDRWFVDNAGLGGCSDKDVRELAQLFYEVAHEGGRESVDDALAIVESFGPGISGLNDTYARQVLLAEEVKRLRASHGQAPAGATLPEGWVPLVITHEGQYPEEIAYGPQRMMDRLDKWLRKYFDSMVAAPTTQPAPQQEA